MSLERAASLKARLASGETAVGAWLTSPDPAITRVVGDIGFDFLLVDTEHAPVNRETLQTMMLLLRDSRSVPIVRVPWNEVISTKWALDSGAEGVLVPWVRTADEARTAVAHTTYPPAGVRGFGPRAASDFYRDTDGYLAQADAGRILAVQVEHIDACRSLEPMLEIEGIDWFFIGIGDLSMSMGLRGRTDEPALLSEVDAVIAKARAAGRTVGMAVDETPEEALRWIERGAQFVTVGIDWAWVQQGATAMLSAVRAGIAPKHRGAPPTDITR